MKLKIFSDGAVIEDMLQAYKNGTVTGFTTNPTLMKKSGITDYLSFAKEALSHIKDLPISFEVFSDELDEMKIQAHKLRDLAENVYVKIPVMNTKKQPTYDLIRDLSSEGVKVNITAIFTEEQIEKVVSSIQSNTPAVISIFAGRIANAGIDPEPIMRYACSLTKDHPEQEILWASPREPLNVVQAERCGCDIITVTPDILKSIDNFGKDLEEYSWETVKMFYDDAESAGYKL